MDTKGLRRIHDYCYEIPVTYKKGMRVPGRIYATRSLIEQMDEEVREQTANVCLLPGIIKYGICMPDGHSGYGFPIGGVAAVDPETGVISPGGIGFDINCGVRLMATNLTFDEIQPRLKDLMQALFHRIPSGVGEDGIVKLTPSRIDDAMVGGAAWAVKQGYGTPEDLECIEEGGCMPDADPAAVSAKARERGRGQIGSLGSGNHYLELQVARPGDIFDPDLARRLIIHRENQIVVMIHSGSRGLGHQIATDYLKQFLSVMGSRYGLSMPDRELACAPFDSEDGRRYFRAMNCAVNYAFCNRQVLMHGVRSVLCDFFKKNEDELGLRLIYDVCHNTAKLEPHLVDGRERLLLVHRKGATRAYGPGAPGLPQRYRETGQPVIIGGSMETGSYLLVGTAQASEAFYSTCHGSGRVLSRHQAKKSFNGRELQRRLEDRGIYIMTSSLPGLAEEAGAAYKNIDEVIEATKRAGLSKPVARFTPIGTIKG